MPSTQSPEPITSGGESDTDGGASTVKSNTSSGGGAAKSGGKKKSGGLSLSSLKSPFKFLGKTYCKGCRKKCSGEVLRVNEVYFHNQCFKCWGCEKNLSQGGFFTRDKDYFCAGCYQSSFGTKCSKCNQYVEGEVVTALGKTYHQNCFRCAGCQKPFPTGERVTFTGKSCLCQACAADATLLGGGGASAASPASKPQGTGSTKVFPEPLSLKADSQGGDSRSLETKTSSGAADKAAAGGGGGAMARGSGKCAGCGEELKDGQALMALDKHYHVWCFKCLSCGTLLHGEYMGKDGQPYCEKDYQALFGVKCTYCFRYISGKVLQAGDNNHFHPTCARCTKCGEPFGDGEEMFLQGAAIWHPRCGPSPDDTSSHHVVNGGGASSPYSRFDAASGIDDRASTASEMPHQQRHHNNINHYGQPYGSRASSPGTSMMTSAMIRRGDAWRCSSSHVQSGSFVPNLYNSSSTYSLRRPLQPGDRSGSSSHLQHFHLPPSRRASSSAGDRAGLPPPRLPTTARSSMDHISISGGAGGFRPVSAPPKPGYTHMKSSYVSGMASGTATPVTPYSSFRGGQHQHSNGGAYTPNEFRTEFSSDYMRQSNTYTHGFRSTLGSRGAPPPPIITEHKIYPLHLLFTTNYKLPPDVDRCNLEKHLCNEDFEMVFNMGRDEFYTMPLWRRNDFKKRVRLF